jgi:hypothetical protein
MGFGLFTIAAAAATRIKDNSAAAAAAGACTASLRLERTNCSLELWTR